MDKKKTRNKFVPKSYTFFIIPFYYEGEWEAIHKKITRWQRLQKELYNEDILYPYILELFRKEDPQDVVIRDNKNRLKIFQLLTKDEGIKSEFFFDRLFGKKQVAILEQESSEKETPYALPFRLLNEGNYAPKLFISPSAKIGIMTLCVELGEKSSVHDLQLFNYYLHKRNEISKKGKRTTNYRIVCPIPDAQKKLSDNELNNKIEQYLSPNGYRQLICETQNVDVDHINWDFNHLINFLLNSLGGESPIKYFNKERMHVFTFCSMSDTSLPECEIPSIVMRLSRVVSRKYLLPFDEIERNDAMLQTYQNIYIASSIEGTAMVCVAKDINKGFVSNMQDRFNRQYLLIYLLVIIQRYTLLSIDRRLTEYEAQNKDTDETLWNLINLICKIKVNCYYTDVSIYTHHSQFYQYCCKKLHVPETFKEIDEKVGLLKLTTDRRLHRIEEKSEQLQKMLNIVVAILTIAQVMQAVHELTNTLDDTNWAMCAGAVSLFVIAIIYFISYYKDSLFHLFKKDNNN